MRKLLILTILGISAPAVADKSISHSANGTVTQRLDARDLAKALPIIPRADALDIAQKRVPGTVVNAEIETNDGIRTWQVDIRPPARGLVRLWLNANTGAFLRGWSSSRSTVTPAQAGVHGSQIQAMS